MRGDLAYASQRYAKAQEFYLRARDAGLSDDELNYQIVRSTMESGDAVRGAVALDAVIKAQAAAGKKAPENWYRYAILRLYKADKTAEAVSWSADLLAAYPTRPNWRDAIYNYGFQGSGAKQLTERDRVDLYRLMSASNSLAGQSDYYDYATAALAAGLPNEGKAVIEEGRTATAIPAVDKPAADLAAKAKAGIAAGKTFAVREKAAASASKGDAAAQTGDAYLGARNWGKAIAMYDLALTKGVAEADPVHLHRAIAYARSGDKDKARADLTAITTAPQSEIARFWLAWLDTPPAA